MAHAPAILLIGGDPTNEHPLLAWALRTDVRLNRARIYMANARQIKLERQAKAVLHLTADGYRDLASTLEAGNETTSARRFAEESLSSSSVLNVRARRSRAWSHGD